MKNREKVWFYRFVQCLTPQFGMYHPDYEHKVFQSHPHPDRASAETAAKKRLGDKFKYATIYWEWKTYGNNS